MIIKQHLYGMCAIREDNYNTSLEKVHRLVTEARKDFPELKDDEIKIVVYAGNLYRHQMGIEFDAPASEVPEDYIPIWEQEYTFTAS